MKIRSILPNSSPEILRPMPFRGGSLQVVWDDARDTHHLNFNGQSIGTHHNGYSCRELARRMIAGDTKRVAEQAQYLIDCGGSADLAEISELCR